MKTLTQLKQARDKGIAFLNTEVPEWRESIDKDRLDMSSNNDCIACQVTGMEYDLALERLGLNTKEAIDYALFTGTKWLDYDNEQQMDREYAKLTKVWKEVL